MKKLRNILSAILVSSTLIAPVFAVSVSTKTANENRSKVLKNFSKNKEKLMLLLKEKDIEKLSNLAKSNKDIMRWIVKTQYQKTNSIENDIEALDALNIDFDLKMFMLQNLMDKFEFFQQQKNMQNTNGPQGRWLQKEKISYPYKTPNTHYVYSDPSTYQGQLFYKSKAILNKGSDYLHTKDYVFSDDVSRIGWSTDYIAKINISENIKNNRYELKNYIRLIDNAMNNPEIVSLLDKNDGSLETVLDYIETNRNYYGDLISKAGFASLKGMVAAFEAIPRFLESHRAFKGITFKSIWESTKYASRGPIIRASHAAYGYFLMFEGLRDISIGKSWEKNGFKMGIGAALAALSLSSAPALHVSAAIFVTAAIFVIIDNIGFGNGFSIWDNLHDHGLNDWDYQMKKNSYVMAQIAKKFSLDFTQPVEWMVTDGWFTFPELYIKTGQGNSDNNLVHLSTGLSFNFGNKIVYSF